jgi:hypothetical protein
VQLRHDHVVRALYGPFPVGDDGEATAAFTVTPPTERGRNAALVGFVQDRTTGEVLQTITLRCGG